MYLFQYKINSIAKTKMQNNHAYNTNKEAINYHAYKSSYYMQLQSIDPVNLKISTTFIVDIINYEKNMI